MLLWCSSRVRRPIAFLAPTGCVINRTLGRLVLFIVRSLLAGWIGRDAILMTGINACIYVLSTIPT